MTTLESLLQAIVADPLSEDRWVVLADYLEEHDEDPRRAELLRLHRKMLATCCEPDRHPERAGWQDRIVELLGQGVRPCVPQRTVVLAEGVEMTFSFIPPGAFLMGSSQDEEGRLPGEMQSGMRVTKGFYFGIYPVTQAQWKAVMGRKPCLRNGEETRPVSLMSWEDSMEFCEVLCKRTNCMVRPPTEVEWEYACRAGTTTAFFTGDGQKAMMRAGWSNYDGTWAAERRQSLGIRVIAEVKPTRVGLLRPNTWGLFDMHGNVWEWCRDWYKGGHHHCPFAESRAT